MTVFKLIPLASALCSTIHFTNPVTPLDAAYCSATTEMQVTDIDCKQVPRLSISLRNTSFFARVPQGNRESRGCVYLEAPCIAAWYGPLYRRKRQAVCGSQILG